MRAQVLAVAIAYRIIVAPVLISIKEGDRRPRPQHAPCHAAEHDNRTKKPGERRVGERFRDDKRGQRDARDQVEANCLAVYVGIQRNAAT